VSPARRRVAVLVSGEGTNLQALIDAAAREDFGGRICAVLSNRTGARGLERARVAGIPARHVLVGPTGTANYDAQLRDELDGFEPDLVVLAGYMRIVSTTFVAAYSGRMLNLHPSLLPRHKGVETHRRVLAAGDPHHGATVHFVTDALDGGPAAIQYRIAVTKADTPETLSARVHRGEYIILPKAADWFCRGRLRLVDGTVMLDGEPLRRPVVIEEHL